MTRVLLCLLALALLVALPLRAQQQPTASGVVVPRLIRFAGSVRDGSGKPMSGLAGITFALYKDQEGGAPLWLETQNVPLAASGRYSVLLGATKEEGVPMELFTSGEAQWLGVRAEGQAEQPRVLLVSVPYALKAADADTVGGLPPSAFALAAPAASARPATPDSAAPAATAVVPATSTAVTTPGGVVNKLAKFDATADITSSQLFDNGTNVAIGNTAPAAKLDVSGGGIFRGVLQLPATGTASATSTAGFPSQPLELFASDWNSSTLAAVNQRFRWQAEPLSSNTASPAGTLNLLFASGTGTPAETGLRISSKGLITFAKGQTLPSVTGNETVTGNISAKQLISTVATGTPPLTVTSTTLVPNLNASMLGGKPAGFFASLGSNAFTGSQFIAGNVGIGTTTPAERLDLGNGGNVVIKTDPGSDSAEGNVAYKLIGRGTGGTTNTWAIYTAPVGGGFGVPANSLSIWQYPPNGVPGCCLQRFVIEPSETAGNVNTVIIDDHGTLSVASMATGFLLVNANATVIGELDVDKDLVVAGCVQVPVGNIIAGSCLSDARLKKNIRPFAPVLDKIVRLQPVSYNWRTDEFPQYHLGSSRSFGLIAQQVQRVFPEMVSVDKDGFNRVNYSPLPLMMLEAIRELKAENDDLKKRIDALERSLPAGK